MWKLLAAAIVIILLLTGLDFIISSAVSETTIITITEKSIDNNKYYIGTVSLKKFEVTRDLYYELDLQGTYKVKIVNNNIEKVVSRLN